MLQDDPHSEEGTLPFWQDPNFKIERYMDEFHKLNASNEEIQSIEEMCKREHYDPAEEEHRRMLRHTHVFN